MAPTHDPEVAVLTGQAAVLVAQARHLSSSIDAAVQELRTFSSEVAVNQAAYAGPERRRHARPE